MTTPYQLEAQPDGAYRITHSDIPRERLNLRVEATTLTETLVVRRLLALLNAANGLPVEALPEHAELLEQVR